MAKQKIDSFVEDSFVSDTDSFAEDSFVEETPKPQTIPTFRAGQQQAPTPMLDALRAPSQMMKRGVSALRENPIEGAANIGSAALSTVALPFTAADVALRKVPVVGEPAANAIAAPFQAIGNVVQNTQDAITSTGIPSVIDRALDTYNVMQGGIPTSPEKKQKAADAMTMLNQGLAQFLVAGKAGQMMPKSVNPMLDASKSVSPKAVADPLKSGEKIAEPTAKPSEVPIDRSQSVQKMIGILNEAKPIRNAQERLYSQRKAEQLPMLSRAFKSAQGEQGAVSAKGVLKGELPKAQYESVRPKVEQADVDFFFNEVAKSDKISDWDRLAAVEGLTKIFSKEGGSVPTKNEIAKLETVFGKDFAEAVLNKEVGWDKFKKEIPDLINLPRTLMSSFDMSMPLRQGVIQSASHPIIAGRAFKEMNKAFFSKNAYENMKAELQARPNADLYRDTKLHIPSLEIEYKPKSLSVREDGFVSRFMQTTKIPVLKQIGVGVKASERAALTYLSKIRADVFDMYADQLQKSGVTPEKNPNSYKALADWVNVSTGRGEYGSLERFAPTASALMFSPRLLKARIDILNPVHYAKMPKEVRVMAMKDMLKFTSAVTGLLTLAKIGGAKVELDPRSTDFAKIKSGNTRFEVTGGIQPLVRFLAQFTTGQRKKFDGEIINMDNSSPYAGNRFENLIRFGQGKLNPHASFLVDLMKDQNFFGEEFEMTDEIASRVTPLYLQDALDAARQEGLLKGAAIAIPAFYGVGTNTYPPKPKPVFRLPSTKPPKP